MNQQESKKLESKILSILGNHLQVGDTVVAGISGGPDSIFLLHFLKKLPIKIIVAHVNHMLRKEADGDEEFVKRLCTSNGHTKFQETHISPSQILSTNATQTYARASHSSAKQLATILFAPLASNIFTLSQKSKQGLEECGRKVRYDFFNKLAKKHEAKFIITAHHADDNLETIILNFTRGASLQGLAGMQECENSKAHTPTKITGLPDKQASLLRPLLTISKKQILDFLRSHKIKFRVDKSNDSLVYRRNFIRHKIVPLLKKLNPSITETLAKNSENLREINQFLKSEAEDWINKNIIKSKKTEHTKIPTENFRKIPKALQKIILLQIYEKLIGNTRNLKSINLDEILTIIDKNIGNKKKKFGQLNIILKNNIATLN